MSTVEIYANAEGKKMNIKKGYAWLGLPFGALWCLYNRLWEISVILIVIYIMAYTFKSNPY